LQAQISAFRAAPGLAEDEALRAKVADHAHGFDPEGRLINAKRILRIVDEHLRGGR